MLFRSTAAMYWAQDITTIYVLRFLAGIGAGGEYGVGITLIAENFDRDHIGTMTSVAAIGGQIGAILAAVCAAIMLPLFGWRELFLFGLIPVLLTYFIRRHVHESEEFLQVKQQQQTSAQKVSVLALFQTPQRTYQTLALMLMVIVQIAGYFGLMNWLPSIMQKRLGLSISGSSLWMIATIVGMSIGMMTFGKI